jgi:mycoredoxin
MDITVYSAAWCRDCRTAKRFLTDHNIAFTDVDIESTPGAPELVISNVGKRAIPQFVIDGKWVQPYKPGQGFLFDEMSELLDVNGTNTK